jgi:hypothetical protein
VTLKSITLILMREKHLGLVIYQVAHGLWEWSMLFIME